MIQPITSQLRPLREGFGQQDLRRNLGVEKPSRIKLRVAWRSGRRYFAKGLRAILRNALSCSTILYNHRLIHFVVWTSHRLWCVESMAGPCLSVQSLCCVRVIWTSHRLHHHHHHYFYQHQHHHLKKKVLSSSSSLLSYHYYYHYYYCYHYDVYHHYYHHY